MKKTERESHIKIASRESFFQEFDNLLKKINDNIKDLAQYERSKTGEPTVVLIEKLNRLKYHRKKLKSQIKKVNLLNEKYWTSVRQESKQVFKDAYAELLSLSNIISSN